MAKEEKIWVVTETRSDGTRAISAYDNQADAENYYTEMRAAGNPPAEIALEETVLNRREEFIPSDDTPWGALRMDIKSEFVEGLMEDMVPLDQIRPGAANRFICEKVEMVRRRTLDRLDEIVRKETREELKNCHEDWSRGSLRQED